MRFRITEDKKFLQIQDSTQLELEQFEYSFTKKINSWFILKKKIPNWDGDIKFIDKFQRVPIGLWKEVLNFAKKYNFELEIDGLDIIINKSYNPKDFNNWVKEYFKDSEDLHPRDYQIEATNKILKYKNCTEEISTSGGKTLIAFMVFRYLLDKNIIKKMLYIVPNINLVTQTEEKFYEYEERCNKKPNWKSKCVFSRASKNEENANIIFGTFQSLTKKNLDYFKDVDAVCADECHHTGNNSSKSIIIKCYNTIYKFGLTGTLPQENSCDSFVIQSYLGPKVYDLYSADLIKSGNATPVQVIGIELDYLNKEFKKKLFELRSVKSDEKDGAKLLNLEKDTAREDRKRFNYICDIIKKSTKNSLVIFSDIKNSYGRNVYNWLRENSDKTVFYIDGETKVENRDYYKSKMEEDQNVIIVASAGTFSEGIDINNVFNIYIIESYKSEIVVAQILGRGMRLQEGKEIVTIIDFIDNFEFGGGFQKKNYLMRHGDERTLIYIKRKFPYKRFKIKL